MTRLERFMKQLEPAVSIDPVHRRVDEALRTLPVPARSAVRNYLAFEDRSVLLWWHIEPYLRDIADFPQRNTSDALHQCRIIYRALFGSEGETAAYEMVHNNVEGGWRKLVHAFAHKMADDFIDEQLALSTDQFWNLLSTPGKHAAADEFILKWGFLLPGELTENSAARIRTYLPEYLKRIPEALQRLQQISLPA
jgi:hypothetical protein